MSAGLFYSPKTINCRGKIVSLEHPLVMGIMNITPDSFYVGSRAQNEKTLLSIVNQMVIDGMDILDLGSVSTRPGANFVSASDEIQRSLPALTAIRHHFPELLISIDSFRSEVFEILSPLGIDFVNDVSGGRQDPTLWSWAAKHQIPCILMHSRGDASNMNSQTIYTDLIKEMLDYFIGGIKELRYKGIKDIILDPGFGFAKNLNQNFHLLKNINVFQLLELPILVGLSRKSMVWSSLKISPEEALNGTSALHMTALEGGAKILRVHDVKEAKQVIQLWKNLNNNQ